MAAFFTIPSFTFILISPLPAQSPGDEEGEEDIQELSPFTVESTEDTGYLATTTLAGTRLRTDLDDIGAAVSVLTRQFMEDIGGTDNQSVLTYATNFEVAGLSGNYQGATAAGGNRETNELQLLFAPQSQTRVRGLINADNTRHYFRTAVAWDGYNVSRIDLLRGPNSILFGLGEPGGVVNATTDTADLQADNGKLSFSLDQFDATRFTLNYNKVIFEDQLAVRVAGLVENKKFRQQPAFDDDERLYITAKYKPEILNRNGMSFRLNVNYEKGNQTSNRPRTAPATDFFSAWIEPSVIPDYHLPEGTNQNGYANGIVPGATFFVDHASVSFVDVMNRDLPDDTTKTDFAAPQGPFFITDHDDPGLWRMGRLFVGGATNPDGSIYLGGNPARARSIYGPR